MSKKHFMDFAPLQRVRVRAITTADGTLVGEIITVLPEKAGGPIRVGILIYRPMPVLAPDNDIVAGKLSECSFKKYGCSSGDGFNDFGAFSDCMRQWGIDTLPGETSVHVVMARFGLKVVEIL